MYSHAGYPAGASLKQAHSRNPEHTAEICKLTFSEAEGRSQPRHRDHGHRKLRVRESAEKLLLTLELCRSQFSEHLARTGNLRVYQSCKFVLKSTFDREGCGFWEGIGNLPTFRSTSEQF